MQVLHAEKHNVDPDVLFTPDIPGVPHLYRHYLDNDVLMHESTNPIPDARSQNPEIYIPNPAANLDFGIYMGFSDIWEIAYPFPECSFVRLL